MKCHVITVGGSNTPACLTEQEKKKRPFSLPCCLNERKPRTMVVDGGFYFKSLTTLGKTSWISLLPCIDHRLTDALSGLSSQRRVHTHSSTGRAQSRRADAVQVRGETLPRPLLRQQAQLLASTHRIGVQI